jgi:flavorubredoxin
MTISQAPETIHTTAFPPMVPTITVPPTKIADETWVIHQVQDATGEPLQVFLNSMVIRGAEPVIVDTGTPANRTQWLEDVFALVEPEDVRWIFLSHDDVDHTGNLDEALAACPNATLVCNWAMVERHSNCFDFPLRRCRWVMHGESFDVGDRTLQAIRPPPAGCTTQSPRCTGRSTRSPRRCLITGSASPTSTRSSGDSA